MPQNRDDSTFHKPPDRPSAWLLPAIIFLPAIAVVLGVFVSSEFAGVPFVTFTRDAAIAYTKDAPFYGGALSNLGAALWTIAMSLSLFAGMTHHGSDARGIEMRRFLIAAGLLSAVLLIDDLFMIHDGLLPLIGRGQKPVLAAQGLFMLLLLLVRFRRVILQTHYGLLVWALVIFALSLVVDLELAAVQKKFHHLLEDGLKLIGIAGWCGYFTHTSVAAARENAQRPSN